METWKISENRNFKVNGTNDLTSKYLYIHKDYFDKLSNENPYIMGFLTLVRSNKTDPDYYKVDTTIILNKNSVNDCLQFAEGLAKQDVGYKGTASQLQLASGKTTDLIGITDNKNLKLALQVFNDPRPIHNEHTNPKIGSAYAIIPTTLPINDDICPYHIASVIFKDGTSNITLEANAGEQNLKHPLFDIYTPQDTFHDRYKKTYENDNLDVITTELVPKKTELHRK